MTRQIQWSKNFKDFALYLHALHAARTSRRCVLHICNLPNNVQRKRRQQIAASIYINKTTHLVGERGVFALQRHDAVGLDLRGVGMVSKLEIG